MKLAATFLLSLFFRVLAAQEFALPVIDSVGSTIHNFIPKGWSVIDTVFGDLNKDKLEDVAMVIQSNDTIKEYLYNSETKKSDELNEDLPRILIILFKGKIDGKFHLAAQDNQFILRSLEGGMSGEPFNDPMTIEKNVLTISFMGGTSHKWMVSYKFRFQNNDFYLIGASTGNVHTVLGTMENNSYNFLTKKMNEEKCDNVFDDASKTTFKTRAFSVKELKTLKSLIRPFLWEIEPGNYL